MCLMGAVVRSELKVEVKRKEVVAVLLPLQEHWLPLSNLDLLLPALDVGVFFCYKNPTAAATAGSGSGSGSGTGSGTGSRHHHHDFSSMVNVLKKSLAQALVSYYLFAGELVLNSAGEPELLCNNRGVDFIEAHADVDLCRIDLHNPDATVEGKLVPKKQEAGVFSVQATELRCGGIVVGCKFDHRVADAYSTNMFLVAWSEIARLKSTSLIPCLRRSLLNPTRPLRYDPSLDDMYVPLSKLPPPPPARVDDNDMISRIYYVTAQDLEWLQSQACSSDDDDDDDHDHDGGDGDVNDNENNYSSINGGGGYKQQQQRRRRRRRRISKLESFSALLWQIIAKSVCDDAGTSKKRCKIGVVVDGRKRLGSCCKAASTNADDEQQQQQEQDDPMASYFGNVLSIPFGEARAEDLKRRPLSWAAKAVHQFLESAVTKEHFLGLIDWVEAHRPEPAVAKIYCNLGGGSDQDEEEEDPIDNGHGHGHGLYGPDPNPAFVVSSGQRFPVSKVDFGWGKPVFGSYHFPWGGDAGYVMPMPTANGNGDWLVYMHLFRAHMDLLEADALGASLFRPITSDYLLL